MNEEHFWAGYSVLAMGVLWVLFVFITPPSLFALSFGTLMFVLGLLMMLHSR